MRGRIEHNGTADLELIDKFIEWEDFYVVLDTTGEIIALTKDYKTAASLIQPSERKDNEQL